MLSYYGAGGRGRSTGSEMKGGVNQITRGEYELGLVIREFKIGREEKRRIGRLGRKTGN